MSKLIKKVLNTISYIIVILVLVFVMLVSGLSLFGIEIYTVLSGSMEPAYKVGSLIYVKEVDVNKLSVNDVITFKVGDVVVTHRIAEISYSDNGNKLFYTKGDVNELIDEVPVASQNIIGTPIFTIPYLGYVTTFIKTGTGKIVTMMVGITLMLIVVAIDLLNKNNKDLLKGSKV